MNTIILALAFAPGAHPIDDVVLAASTAFEAARSDLRTVADAFERAKAAQADGAVGGGQVKQLEMDYIRACDKYHQLRKIRNVAVLVRVIIRGNTSNEPAWKLYR